MQKCFQNVDKVCNGLGCNFCDKDLCQSHVCWLCVLKGLGFVKVFQQCWQRLFHNFFATNVTSQAISLWTLWKHFFKWTFNFMNSTHMTSQSLSFSKTRIPCIIIKGFLPWWTDTVCLFKWLSWWFKLYFNVPSSSINH